MQEIAVITSYYTVWNLIELISLIHHMAVNDKINMTFMMSKI